MMDEPPYERNGMGLPESGKMPMTPQTLSSIWKARSEVHPTATRRPERSDAQRAIFMPCHAMTPKAARTPRVPTRPHSSPMMAKMKSLWAMGR